MAAPSTSEQSEVRRKGRQRLVGAVAIVVLAVVFVPMVLDREPRKERPEGALSDKSLAIPSKDGAPPLPAPLAAPAKPVAQAAAPEVPKSEPKSEPKLGSGAAPKAESRPATVAAAPKAAGAPELKGFAVQVGAFRDEDKLKAAREKLSAGKIPHFTERLAAGDLTRLRAGPYPTREAAEKAMAVVKSAGLEGKVVPLP